jgi:hypothetical protein
MTTDELERDLKMLAEPQADDERLRLALRATLDAQLQGHPKTRRHTRLVLGSAAVAAATLAAAAVALIGTGGSGPSSANAAILAHVVWAITPPANIIVHVKEAGLHDGTQVAAEWWQETNPPYAIRLIKGAPGQQADSEGNTGGQQVESAADGTTLSQYDAGTNTIYQRPDSTSPTLIDPIEAVRAGLASGAAQVAGTVTIDAKSLYKIELPNGVVGYFDRSDYRPVYLDNPQRDGSVVRTRVITYEELSITPENETLLSITAQHPRASVSKGPSPASAKEK